jgi:cytochrome c oxidase assembly protein subunit 15
MYKQKIQNRLVFRLLSFFSLCLVFTVIIVGAYVSASGQGLSCPDWPLCPNGFSFPPAAEYFTEYIHRVIAIMTAISVYCTTAYSVKVFAAARTVALLGSIAVSLQIFIGLLIIHLQLQPLVVAIHTGVGVISFAMILLAFILSYSPLFNNMLPSKDFSDTKENNED